MLLEAIEARRRALEFDPYRHLLAKHAIALDPVDDADPFAGSARVALYRGEAGHRIDVDAAKLHHVIAAAQQLVHAPKIAATGAGGRRSDALEVAHVEADQRWDMPVQNSDDEIP